MMSDNDIYSAPSSDVGMSEESIKPKASLGLKLTAVILVVIGAFLSGLFQFMQVASIPAAAGAAVGGALFWPLVIVGLFQIGRRFRNQRSRYKIFIWSEVVVIILWALNILLSLGQWVYK